MLLAIRLQVRHLKSLARPPFVRSLSAGPFWSAIRIGPGEIRFVLFFSFHFVYFVVLIVCAVIDCCFILLIFLTELFPVTGLLGFILIDCL